MVLGVRVHGKEVENADVSLDDKFRLVPVAARLGIPLLCKRLYGTGGDDSNIRSNVIVRFLADPDDGMAPMEWQYGGGQGPAPPVVLARKDGLPFSAEEWHVVDEYIGDWLDECSEADDRSTVNERLLQPGAFAEFLQGQWELRPNAFLDVRFPRGCMVIAQGLSMQELNGVEGEVVQYSRDRVGVRFPGREEPVALKPERLQVAKAAPELPEAKRLDTGEAKIARKQELDRQEATAICNRFVSCLCEDTFPEAGELHLFGVGCEYHARAQDVLGVWQGAVKHQDLEAPPLIEAMLAGNMPEYFQEVCQKLADSSTPNASYARKIIENRFAAVEWDTLL